MKYFYKINLIILVFLLCSSSPLYAQGKAKKEIEKQEKIANSLYENGKYKEACDIYIANNKLRNGANESRILRGIVSFFLVDIIGILFFLYIEKRKAYKLLVEKNKICASRPVINTSSINFQETNLENDNEKHLLDQIQQLFESDKIYLDSELTIESLSTRLGVTRAVISKIVNQHIGCSFPTLLNHYRINEAIRLLTNDETKNYKMEAISLMSGYNNRQVFHSAFKKETGLTPTEFKNVSMSND